MKVREKKKKFAISFLYPIRQIAPPGVIGIADRPPWFGSALHFSSMAGRVPIDFHDNGLIENKKVSRVFERLPIPSNSISADAII